MSLSGSLRKNNCKKVKSVIAASWNIHPNAIAVHRRGKICVRQSAASNLLGATDEVPIIGMPIMNIIHPDDIE